MISVDSHSPEVALDKHVDALISKKPLDTKKQPSTDQTQIWDATHP